MIGKLISVTVLQNGILQLLRIHQTYTPFSKEMNNETDYNHYLYLCGDLF